MLNVAQSGGIGRINFMDNLDESARHLIRAIKYSVENGNGGVVNIDEIFNGYNPNTTPNVQGFYRTFQMAIDGKNMWLKIDMGTPVGATSTKYDPIIDFSFQGHSNTSRSYEQGHYFHMYYCGGGRDGYGPSIGVGDIRPNLWTNWNIFGKWLWGK